MTGISGTKLTEEEVQFIEAENIGGVILFSHNYESPEQLAELVNSIQGLRKEYPLFISVDHEGGRVIRFKKDFTQFPAMLNLTKTGSPKFCFYTHKIMAEELNACGINLSYSPCCDILTNEQNKVIGNRAFGDSSEDVSLYISAAIRGLQTNGLMSCAKHFPGHGSTSEDSHMDLPVVESEMNQLEERDILPFVKAIKSRVEFVMMGHLVVKAIDDKLPCSLSKSAHEYLRKNLKFNKIIISDDMQMKAITDNYSVADAVRLSLNAGTDILVYRDIEDAKSALVEIKNQMKIKQIKNADVNEKLKRIYECKKKNLKNYNPIYIPEVKRKINTRASQTFLNEINLKIDAKM